MVNGGRLDNGPGFFVALRFEMEQSAFLQWGQQDIKYPSTPRNEEHGQYPGQFLTPRCFGRVGDHEKR